MDSRDPASEASGTVRTRRSVVTPAVNPYWVLVLALAGLVLVLYGFFWQPARQYPFAKPANWIDWFLHPLPAAEINGLGQRPLGSPGAGWAPRALGETQAAWIGEGALQLRPEGRYPALVLWSDETGAIVGADGRIYLRDQPPREPARTDRSPIQILEFKAHEEKVASAAFSPDGTRIVTASADGMARIWNATNGRRLNDLSGHTGVVQSAAFSPDGTLIVTASDDTTARIWDAVTGSELRVLRGHEQPVMSASFSADGTRIVTASVEGTARIWDAATGKQLLLLTGHNQFMFSAAFSPDGKRVVTTSEQTTVPVWDAATGKEIEALTGHEGPIASAMYSPDGRSIVTASADRTVRIWNNSDGKNTDLLGGYAEAVYTAAFSPDGRDMLTASADGTVRIWVTAAGQQRETVEMPGIGANSAAFSPDGSRIVTASDDGTVRVYSIMRGSVPSAGVRLPDGTVCWTASAVSWNCSSDSAFRSVLLSLRMNEHARGGPLAPFTDSGGPDGTVDEKGQQIQQQQILQQTQDVQNQLQQQLQLPQPQERQKQEIQNQQQQPIQTQQQQQQQQQPDQQRELNPPPPAQLSLPADLPASATFRALAFFRCHDAVRGRWRWSDHGSRAAHTRGGHVPAAAPDARRDIDGDPLRRRQGSLGGGRAAAAAVLHLAVLA